jgi:hypothetical protein
VGCKIFNTTITANAVNGFGGGIYNESANVNLKNTLIALNTADVGSDLYGTFTSLGYNLIGNVTGATINSATGDQFGTNAAPLNPLLGPLASNGGPTRTHLPQVSSPAIDAGEPNYAGSLITDQRGFKRVADGNGDNVVRLDIGAVERGNCVPDNYVTLTSDDGQGTLCGTFSYALKNTNSGTIQINLSTTPTLTLTGPLAAGIELKNGVTLSAGRCGIDVRVTINGAGVSGDGLKLLGHNTVRNIWIKGFVGRQLVVPGPASGKNTFECFKASKT